MGCKYLDFCIILIDNVVLEDLPARERIEYLQAKLNEVRRLYNSRRAEAMSIDRKLKKYRKKVKEKGIYICNSREDFDYTEVLFIQISER